MPPRAEDSSVMAADARPRAASVAASAHMSSHGHTHRQPRRVSEAFPHRPSVASTASKTHGEMSNPSSTSGKRERQMWCSWCLEKGPHVVIKESTLFGRDKVKCKGCWGFGKPCLLCGIATAKEYSNGDTDKLCMACSGGIPKWGEKNVETEKGWCSWCFKDATHELVQKNVLGRNVYKCAEEGCGRRTLKCTDCLYLRFQSQGDAYNKVTEVPPLGFARGDVNEGDDKWCAIHDGTIEAWGMDSEELDEELTRERYCSWCIQWTSHRLEKTRYVGRDTFVCDECSMPTLVCYACDSGMAMGGALWDDRTCVVCQGLALGMVADGTEMVNEKVLAADGTISAQFLAPTSPASGRSLAYYSELKVDGKKDNTEDDVSRKSSVSAMRIPIGDQDVAAFTGTWEKILTRKFNTYMDMLEPKNAQSAQKKTSDSVTQSAANEKPVSPAAEPKSAEGSPASRRSTRPNVGLLANKEKWEALIARKDAIFLQSWGAEEMRAELERDTPEKEMASKAGMIRPFLYLVSMSPVQRNRVANLLGWSLVADPTFGDAHREAWEIIKARTGFLGRAQEFDERINNKEPDWLAVMQRVFTEVFPGEDMPESTVSLQQSREMSKSVATSLEPALEEHCLHILVEFSRRQLTNEQLVDQKEEMASDLAQETMATISQHAAIQDVDVLQYGTLAVLGVNELKKTQQVSSVLGNISKVAGLAQLGVLAVPLKIISSALVAVKVGQLAMGSSSSRLFGPVVMLLQQRLSLGAASLDIAEFY